MKNAVVPVKVKVLEEGRGLELPSYQTEGAAGMDLLAAVTEDVTINPGERTRVSAGIAIALPPGYEGQVRPRSGLALKKGLTLLNAPGTVDSDYRGAIGVILINLGADPVVVRRGDRIAQMIIGPVPSVRLAEVEELPPSGRGDGGFGHTGS